MNRFASVGALYGFLGVALGAFGAHLLRDRMTAEELARVETGSRYLLIHAVALFALGLAMPETKAKSTAGWCWSLGAAVFCGSLLLLALGAGRFWGAVTPIGGSLLLAGWAIVFWSCVKSANPSQIQ